MRIYKINVSEVYARSIVLPFRSRIYDGFIIEHLWMYLNTMIVKKIMLFVGFWSPQCVNKCYIICSSRSILFVIIREAVWIWLIFSKQSLDIFYFFIAYSDSSFNSFGQLLLTIVDVTLPCKISRSGFKVLESNC